MVFTTQGMNSFPSYGFLFVAHVAVMFVTISLTRNNFLCVPKESIFPFCLVPTDTTSVPHNSSCKQDLRAYFQPIVSDRVSHTGLSATYICTIQIDITLA